MVSTMHDQFKDCICISLESSSQLHLAQISSEHVTVIHITNAYLFLYCRREGLT